MPAESAISTHRPSHDEGLARVRSGNVAGLFATDGFFSYAFTGTERDGRLTAEVTDLSGTTVQDGFSVDTIEGMARHKLWAFVSELDAYLLRERYVRLDPDACSKIALQITHKSMRYPMEEFHDRFSQEEMATFNKTCLNRAFTILAQLYHPTCRSIFFDSANKPDNWDAPVIDDGLDLWANAIPGWRPDMSLKEPWIGGTAVPVGKGAASPAS